MGTFRGSFGGVKRSKKNPTLAQQISEKEQEEAALK